MSDMHYEPHGDGSRKRSAGNHEDHSHHAKRNNTDDQEVLFRIACPVEKTGTVIGKGGDVIRSIRESSGARVKIDDSPKGMPERAIIIFSQDRPGEDTCAAQDALDKILVRMFQPDDQPPPETTELVLLVDRTYVGIIVGKGGENVTRIRTTSSAGVSILKKGAGSPLEGPDEETVVINGRFESVRIAAKMLIDKMREGSSQKGYRPSASTLAIALATRQTGGAVLTPPGMVPGGAPMHAFPPGPPAPSGGSTGGPPPAGSIHTEYRLLVDEKCAGSIIGKGGDRLRTLREQSRAEVRVERQVEGCTERLVFCGSWELPESEYCAAAEAFMTCAKRAVSDKTAPNEYGQVLLRLLAPTTQMSQAVLGPNGNTIRQVALDTGAHMVLLPRERCPALVGPNDEVLEISGDPQMVLEGLRIATMLLRGFMIRQQHAARPPAPAAAQPQFGAAAPAQQYGAPAPQFGAAPQQYDAYGQPAAAAPAAYGQQPAADPYAAYYASQAQQQAPQSQPYASYGQPGYEAQGAAPSSQSGYQTSAAPAPAAAYNPYNPTQSASAYGGNPEFAPPAAYGGPAPSAGPPSNPPQGSLFNPTISSSGMAAGMIRYTMNLNSHEVGTLLGARGSNISAIRTASGARIKVHDSRPGVPEREVEVSGQISQVSTATTAMQTLISTGTMPSNIPK